MTPTGLTATELDDIQQLNRAFLRLIAAEPDIARPLAAELSPALATALAADGLGEVLLAEPIPFLLFDVSLPRQPVAAPTLFCPSPNVVELALLALGFMQRLGRRERFALRVAGGVTAVELELLLRLNIDDIGRTIRAVDNPVRPALCRPPFLWPAMLSAAARHDRSRLKTLFSLGHQHRLQRAAGEGGRSRRAARAIGVAERTLER
ncbi:MAG: hypothetical protein AAGC71_03365 [Pseudomonadota bacterium]